MKSNLNLFFDNQEFKSSLRKDLYNKQSNSKLVGITQEKSSFENHEEDLKRSKTNNKDKTKDFPHSDNILKDNSKEPKEEKPKLPIPKTMLIHDKKIQSSKNNKQTQTDYSFNNYFLSDQRFKDMFNKKNKQMDNEDIFDFLVCLNASNDFFK